MRTYGMSVHLLKLYISKDITRMVRYSAEVTSIWQLKQLTSIKRAYKIYYSKYSGCDPSHISLRRSWYILLLMLPISRNS